jgi:hypothetical protein
MLSVHGAPARHLQLALTCQAALGKRAQAHSAVTFSAIMTGIVVTADHTTTVNIT